MLLAQDVVCMKRSAATKRLHTAVVDCGRGLVMGMVDRIPPGASGIGGANAYHLPVSRFHGGASYVMGDGAVIEVPSMAESITEGTVAAILKGPGDVVFEDDVIAQLETDKVTIDVKYQRHVPGKITNVHFAEGDTVEVGQAFAEVEDAPDATQGDGGASPAPATDEPPKEEAQATPSPDISTSFHTRYKETRTEASTQPIRGSTC